MSFATRGNALAEQLEEKQVFAPQSITDTDDGNEIDIVDPDISGVITLSTGALVGVDADNYFIVKVKQSDTSGGSFVDALDDQYYPIKPEGETEKWDFKIDDAGEADGIYRFNFVFEVDQKFVIPYLEKVGTPTSMQAEMHIQWLSGSPATG